MLRILTTAMLICVAATIATAQSKCAPRDKIVSQLADKYGEVSHGVGLASGAKAVEMWSSEKTGTWSIIITNASGLTCVLAVGKDWIANPEFGKGEGL